jgi:hypothetical protein
MPILDSSKFEVIFNRIQSAGFFAPPAAVRNTHDSCHNLDKQKKFVKNFFKDFFFCHYLYFGFVNNLVSAQISNKTTTILFFISFEQQHNSKISEQRHK